jgi:GGDEF domain-containing protein
MQEPGTGGSASRPVPTAPIEALTARAEDVAKRWLIELMAAVPLDAAAQVPTADLAADAPGVCAAVVEALASDSRLESALSTAPDVARLAGARDPAAAVAAAETLRNAIAMTLREEVPRDDDALLAALADRLAHVCALLAGRAAAVLAGGELPAPAPAAAADRDAEVAAAISRPADGGEDFAPLWMPALERLIGSGRRFALLIMELDGAERLKLAEPSEVLADVLERVGLAVRGCVRAEDILAHETGRLWAIAPGAGRGGATALAQRIADAVEQAAELRGAPLTASLGVALFPDDAREPAALAGEAEESLLAARAAGVRFTAGSDEPPAVGPRLVK